MSVCPRCQAEGFDPNFPCRRCGRGGTGRPGGPSAVPDLDFGALPSPPASGRLVDFEEPPHGSPVAIDAAAARPQAGRQAVAPPAHTAPPTKPQMAAPDMGRGAMFDDDEESFGAGGAGLSLELDVKGGPPVRGMMAPQAQSGAPQMQQQQQMQQQMAPPKQPSFRPMPAAVHERHPSVAPIESFEAKMLGNFGDSPAHFWQAPRYAWRVRQRLAELREALKERRQQAERASKAIDQSLIALGQRARGTAERNPQYGRTLDLLRIHEQTLRQKDSALMGEMDTHNRKLVQIDQKITELQAMATQMQAEERRVADELAMAQATVQRAEAKLKRLDIDLRSAFGPNDPRRGGS
jgi:hypothetical protein